MTEVVSHVTSGDILWEESFQTVVYRRKATASIDDSLYFIVRLTPKNYSKNDEHSILRPVPVLVIEKGLLTKYEFFCTNVIKKDFF